MKENNRNIKRKNNSVPLNRNSQGKRKKKPCSFLEFNEKDRKEYLTGFRKRKLERQKSAKKKEEEIISKEKKELRKKKLENLKLEAKEIEERILYFDSYIGRSNLDSEDEENEGDDQENQQEQECEEEQNGAVNAVTHHPHVIKQSSSKKDFHSKNNDVVNGNLSSRLKKRKPLIETMKTSSHMVTVTTSNFCVDDL